MKDVLKDNAWNIMVLLVTLVGMYFTVQSNSDEIESLKLKIVEMETNKVSVSTMDLKEQFLASELMTIEGDIQHIDERLTKKIKLQNAMSDDLSCLVTDVAVHEEQIIQGKTERVSLWKFTNKFLEKL